jgi:hypothetical protein
MSEDVEVFVGFADSNGKSYEPYFSWLIERQVDELINEWNEYWSDHACSLKVDCLSHPNFAHQIIALVLADCARRLREVHNPSWCYVCENNVQCKHILLADTWEGK